MICSIFKIFLEWKKSSLLLPKVPCLQTFLFLSSLANEIQILSPIWLAGGGSYANTMEEFPPRTICSPFTIVHVFVPYTRKFSSRSGHARSQHPWDFCSFFRNEDTRTDHLRLLINNHCHQDEESGSQHMVQEYSLDPSTNAILASLHEKGVFTNLFLPQC